jgi:hypothetical protein
MKEHLDPVFAKQKETWQREGPAAEQRAQAAGIVIDSIGGNCPVQAEGSFDGMRFYFRARGGGWEFHVWTAEKALAYRNLPFGEEDWLIERGYGDGYDAGWMPKHEAIGFICDSVAEYRTQPEPTP